MKRMIAFVFVVVMMVFVQYEQRNNINIAEYANRAVVVSENVLDEIHSVDMGYEFYTGLSEKKINNVFRLLHNKETKGINFYFSNKLSLNFFKANLGRVFSCKNVGHYEVYYGYYSGYKDFRWIEGKKVNCQLVKTEDSWILGFPLILTGF